MKKERRVLFILLTITFLLLISNLALAEINDTQGDDESDKIDKAYSCLENQIQEKTCEDLSVEEQAFSLLAVGKCKSELQDNSKDNECWPSSGCRLRDTSLALLALDGAGSSTNDAEDWLVSQKKTPSELIWYLEIDSNEETKCKISYDGTVKTVTGKGFGFISQEDTDKDIFYHETSLEGDLADRKLRVGDKVKFEVEEIEKGPRAVKIELIED